MKETTKIVGQLETSPNFRNLLRNINPNKEEMYICETKTFCLNFSSNTISPDINKYYYIVYDFDYNCCCDSCQEPKLIRKSWIQAS